MQTMDDIILKKKVWYPDLVAIYKAMHAAPKWMKNDDDCLKPFKTKKEKAKDVTSTSGRKIVRT